MKSSQKHGEKAEEINFYLNNYTEFAPGMWQCFNIGNPLSIAHRIGE